MAFLRRLSFGKKFLPISHGQNDIVDRCFLEDVVDFSLTETSHIFTVDLKDLVPESKSTHGRRASTSHKANENTFVDGLDSKANFAIRIFTQDHLERETTDTLTWHRVYAKKKETA